ncbi:MAG: hypothetical protein ACK4UL_09985 [Novosphingobium meiothermophilum]|uniref:hypothetical protein n=1 Tax=Novosphingobium TaxID=165696 RepID=UPI000D6DF349|nr:MULTISPECIES: hypothetical protein [Novosphingobium]
MKRKPVSLPQVASFECSECGAVHHSRDAKAPVGWTQRHGAIWCTDCTRSGIATRIVGRSRPSSSPSDKVRLRGEVLALLRRGAALMPAGSAQRAEWVREVNDLIARQQRAA